MKRTLTINLGGLVFHIDEDAYEALKVYLSRIEGHFANREERKEIIDDIEARLAELLHERMSDRKQVVSLADVQELISVLGDPDEIGDTAEETPGLEAESAYRGQGYRRIYRDPDNRVLGGVAAGLAAYFNVDPLIFRILFVLFLIAGGSGLLVYIILWIVIPEARTRAQKMEMRGEPVTIENIGRTVRDEFNEVRSRFRGNKKQ